MSVWVIWEADADGAGSAKDVLQEGRGVPQLCAVTGGGLAEKSLSSAHTLGQLGTRAHLSHAELSTLCGVMTLARRLRLPLWTPLTLCGGRGDTPVSAVLRPGGALAPAERPVGQRREAWRLQLAEGSN